MKGNMLIFAPLVLLLCWKLPVNCMTIHLNFTLREANQDIPLNMVENSVDDLYFGCSEAMMKKVKSKYLEEEKYKKPFEDAWNAATQCAENKREHREDEALTNEHLQAICVYTSDYEKFYKTFNDAVRSERSIYSSSFQYHSLHFLLTSAIQILNNNSHCQTTYRRTQDRFIGEVKQRIRFGAFTSSSYKTDLTMFGKETCFKITTCEGAFLKTYSLFEEAEVLIPPYETFIITEIIEGQDKIQSLGVESCKLMYILESAGVKSNLNCKAVYI